MPFSSAIRSLRYEVYVTLHYMYYVVLRHYATYATPLDDASVARDTAAGHAATGCQPLTSAARDVDAATLRPPLRADEAILLLHCCHTDTPCCLLRCYDTFSAMLILLRWLMLIIANDYRAGADCRYD